jgi:transposase InsO family protein
LARHGRPEVFNTDQGAQFTSLDFTSVLLKAGIAISMDGKGSWRDNVFVERLWRSIKPTSLCPGGSLERAASECLIRSSDCEHRMVRFNNIPQWEEIIAWSDNQGALISSS